MLHETVAFAFCTPFGTQTCNFEAYSKVIRSTPPKTYDIQSIGVQIALRPPFRHFRGVGGTPCAAVNQMKTTTQKSASKPSVIYFISQKTNITSVIIAERVKAAQRAANSSFHIEVRQ
jgi:hypothetical protein